MITPLRGYVLIEPEKAEEISTGGIYLPSDSQEKPAKGSVINIGSSTPTYSTEELNLKIGSVVYFKKWAIDEVKHEGKDYNFVKFEDIVGVV